MVYGCAWFQWSFLVPLIGGRYHIIPQLAVYTTYIPLIYWWFRWNWILTFEVEMIPKMAFFILKRIYIYIYVFHCIILGIQPLVFRGVLFLCPISSELGSWTYPPFKRTFEDDDCSRVGNMLVLGHTLLKQTANFQGWTVSFGEGFCVVSSLRNPWG